LTPPWNFRGGVDVSIVGAFFVFSAGTPRLPIVYLDEHEMNGGFGARSSRRH
jgi:hypothetical protein